jgi:murein DD-endopeptidase MepM/ murein hydrolase activator NlpD
LPKKYTVLIIPDGTHRVKRFTMYGIMLPVLFALLVSTISLLGYFYLENQALANAVPGYHTLRQQSQHQNFQISELALQLEDFKEQMQDVKSFNSQLRELSSQDPRLAKVLQPPPAIGLGGLEGKRQGTGGKLVNTVQERQIMAISRELDVLRAESENEMILQQALVNFLQERRSVLLATPSGWPVKGFVTSGYGPRVSPWSNKVAHHAGLDISAPTGTRVTAPADGVVTFVDYDGAYGKSIIISHGYGFTTRYAHLSGYNVSLGQQVERGDVIGYVGSTGRSTGAHLHYEVRISGVPTNPRNYLLD